jgi:hypothetical protein
MGTPIDGSSGRLASAQLNNNRSAQLKTTSTQLKNRLKAIGNANPPQIPYIIGKVIKGINDGIR